MKPPKKENALRRNEGSPPSHPLFPEKPPGRTPPAEAEA